MIGKRVSPKPTWWELRAEHMAEGLDNPAEIRHLWRKAQEKRSAAHPVETPEQFQTWLETPLTGETFKSSNAKKRTGGRKVTGIPGETPPFLRTPYPLPDRG